MYSDEDEDDVFAPGRGATTTTAAVAGASAAADVQRAVGVKAAAAASAATAVDAAGSNGSYSSAVVAASSSHSAVLDSDTADSDVEAAATLHDGRPRSHKSSDEASAYAVDDSDNDNDALGNMDAAADDDEDDANTHSLPECYFERCAVVLDFMPLLPGRQFRELTACPVEGYACVLQFPLSYLASSVSWQHHILYAPELNCRNMTKADKRRLLDAVGTAIKTVHYIAPRFCGCAVNERATAYPRADLHFATTAAQMRQQIHSELFVFSHRNNVKHAAGHGGGSNSNSGNNSQAAEATKKLARVVDEMVLNATRCCAAEGLPDGIAFFTSDEQLDNVQRVLRYFRTQLHVRFPRYTVWTPSTVLSAYWANKANKLLTAPALSYHCELHKTLTRNGQLYHCCRHTVKALMRVLCLAARHLAEHRERVSGNCDCRRLGSGVVVSAYTESDDDDEDDDEDA